MLVWSIGHWWIEISLFLISRENGSHPTNQSIQGSIQACVNFVFQLCQLLLLSMQTVCMLWSRHNLNSKLLVIIKTSKIRKLEDDEQVVYFTLNVKFRRLR